MNRESSTESGPKQIANPRARLEGRALAVFLPAMCFVFILIAAPARAVAEPSPTAAVGFDSYIVQLEARLAGQHSSSTGFLAPADASRLRAGDVVVEQLTPKPVPDLPGAMLHHWRGTAFVPGATAADLERLLRDYSRYPQVYAPQVLIAKVLAHDGNHYQSAMRLSEKHVITVVLDTTYDIRFFPIAADPDAHSGSRGYDISHSTRLTNTDCCGGSTPTGAGRRATADSTCRSKRSLLRAPFPPVWAGQSGHSSTAFRAKASNSRCAPPPARCDDPSNNRRESR